MTACLHAIMSVKLLLLLLAPLSLANKERIGRIGSPYCYTEKECSREGQICLQIQGQYYGYFHSMLKS